MLYIALILFAIFACLKWFAFYCFSRGLLYHLVTKYGDEIDEEQAIALRNNAMKRTIKELAAGRGKIKT